jgi:hypothetical protein
MNIDNIRGNRNSVPKKFRLSVLDFRSLILQGKTGVVPLVQAGCKIFTSTFFTVGIARIASNLVGISFSFHFAIAA